MVDRAVRFQRILCPVDFSPASLRALDSAIQLASLHGARIHVLHVVPRIVASLMDIPITTSRWTTADEERARRELPKLKERARKKGVAATTEIRIGDIDVQILDVLKKDRSDHLAMGTHGRRGFERWALGSVAERMLRRCPIPILLTAAGARRASPGRIRRILVPSDFSKGTRDVMGYAASIAEQTGASIMMLHVIQDGSGAVDLKTFSQQAAAIQQRLTELIPSRGKRSYALETRVDSGEPFRVILKTIEDSKPSLVILNTHGHGFLDRLLIGSTADRVVRGGAAMCPMLLFPSSRRS